MKKILAALAVLLLSAIAAPAMATNCPSFPYTLTNGTTADANQVMSNFNNLLTCSNNYLAHSGTNTDITALVGLTTPLGAAYGGTGQATAPVLTFNTRYGAVTLSSSDVTSALGYTPANKAGDTFSGAVTFSAGLTGTLTGSATSLATGYTIGMTGDLTWASAAFNGTGNVTGTGTLATVNSNVGACGSGTAIPTVTLNAKGLATACSTTALPTATTSVSGVTTLATSTQVVAGTDTTHAVTPASLTSQQSLSANGYYTLPGGLIEEWGTTGSITGSTPTQVNFPLTFPNAVLSVVATRTTLSGGAQQSDAVTSISASNFYVADGRGGDTTTFHWIAIGY